MGADVPFDVDDENAGTIRGGPQWIFVSGFLTLRWRKAAVILQLTAMSSHYLPIRSFETMVGADVERAEAVNIWSLSRGVSEMF